jgi:hypothetical protein
MKRRRIKAADYMKLQDEVAHIVCRGLDKESIRA